MLKAIQYNKVYLEKYMLNAMSGLFRLGEK